MNYSPIVVAIIDQQLKEHYGGNFMLQLWDQTGENVYEKVL